MGETTKAQQEQCSHSCRVSAVGRVEGGRRAEGRGRWIQPSARLSSVCGVRAPQAQWRAAALLALATRGPPRLSGAGCKARDLCEFLTQVHQPDPDPDPDPNPNPNPKPKPNQDRVAIVPLITKKTQGAGAPAEQQTEQSDP